MFRQRLVEMIDLRHPLVVLASRLLWAQIDAALAPYFARRIRDGRVIEQDDTCSVPPCKWPVAVWLRPDARACPCV